MEMARSPLVQQKARENIEQVLERHDGQMSYQALQEMTYLDWLLQGMTIETSFLITQDKLRINYCRRGTQDVSTGDHID
jgi:Cytochrome P450